MEIRCIPLLSYDYFSTMALCAHMPYFCRPSYNLYEMNVARGKDWFSPIIMEFVYCKQNFYSLIA